MLDKRKKKLAATPKKASNFLLLRSKKSILIALKKHCHLIGSEPHRFILHADIHSGLSVFCLIDDYLIIHTADYLLFNYNKDTKPRLKSKEIHLKNKWIQQFIAPAPFAGRGGDLRGVFHLHALSLAHLGLQARAALACRPTGGAGSGIALRVDEGDDREDDGEV